MRRRTNGKTSGWITATATALLASELRNAVPHCQRIYHTPRESQSKFERIFGFFRFERNVGHNGPFLAADEQSGAPARVGGSRSSDSSRTARTDDRHLLTTSRSSMNAHNITGRGIRQTVAWFHDPIPSLTAANGQWPLVVQTSRHLAYSAAATHLAAGGRRLDVCSSSALHLSIIRHNRDTRQHFAFARWLLADGCWPPLNCSLGSCRS